MLNFGQFYSTSEIFTLPFTRFYTNATATAAAAAIPTTLRQQQQLPLLLSVLLLFLSPILWPSVNYYRQLLLSLYYSNSCVVVVHVVAVNAAPLCACYRYPET